MAFRYTERGDFEGAKKFLTNHLDKVNRRNSRSQSCLMVACQEGNPGLINSLIDFGADLDMLDEEDFTALHHAVICRRLQAVRILLTRGCKVNRKNIFGNSPLYLATEKREEWKEGVAALLQSQEVEVNQPDNFGFTPLHMACLNGHTDTVGLLLNHFDIDTNVVDNDGDTPLHMAVQFQHYDVVTLMLSQVSVQSDIENRHKMTPLLLSVLKGHLGMMLKFIAKDADVNVVDDQGNNCLHISVKKKEFHSEVEHMEILDECCTELKMKKKKRLSGVVVASYLARQGANFYCKNKNELTPLDLLQNEKLETILRRLFPPPVPCRLCEVENFSVKFHPCGHAVICGRCFSKIPLKRCLECQQLINITTGFGNMRIDENPGLSEKGVQTVEEAFEKPKSVTKKVQTVAITLESKSQQVEIQLPRKQHLEKVAEQLVNDWFLVGILLEIKSTRLYIINCNIRNDVVKRNYEMLNEWFMTCDPKRCTFGTLKEVLEEVECWDALECLPSGLK